MKNFLLTLGLMFAASTAFGAASNFVIPPNGPLKYVKKSADHFKGTVTLSGKLIFERFPFEDVKEIVVTFVPDAGSSKKLPNRKGLGPVKTVGIGTDKEKLIALLSEEQRQGLLSRKLDSVELQTSLVATDYLSVVICDINFYRMRVIRLLKSKEVPKPSKLRAYIGECG